MQTHAVWFRNRSGQLDYDSRLRLEITLFDNIIVHGRTKDIMGCRGHGQIGLSRSFMQTVLLDWKQDLIVPTIMPVSFIGIKMCM